jgi:hypothetical protein
MSESLTPSVQSLPLNSQLRALAIPLLSRPWKLPKPFRTLRTLPVELPLLPLPDSSTSSSASSQCTSLGLDDLSFALLQSHGQADVCRRLKEPFKDRPATTGPRWIEQAATMRGSDALLDPTLPAASGARKDGHSCFAGNALPCMPSATRCVEGRAAMPGERKAM